MTARVLNEMCFQNFVYICQLSSCGSKPAFTAFDVLLTVLSIVTFFSDIATDIIVVVHYALSELWVYFGLTLLFVVAPSFIVNLFSLRWHIHDNKNTKLVWTFNCLQLGVLYRYVLYLKTGLRAQRSKNAEDFQDLYQQQSDLCMLRLFDSFLESAPQLVLQLYIMVSYESWNILTGVSAVVSLFSLGWGIAAYGKAMRLYRSDKKRLSWTGLVLQTFWRCGTMTSRVTAMVLFAVACGPWIMLVLLGHWIGMTLWVVRQETDFCPNVWEERVYDAVVGAIYTFCFFNVKEGPSRHRVVTFYAIIFVQNLAFLLAYCYIARWQTDYVVASAAIILGSFLIGMCCMALYYSSFHPGGPICIHRKRTDDEIKVMDTTPKKKDRSTVGPSHSFRTLKHVDYRPRGGFSESPPEQSLPDQSDYAQQCFLSSTLNCSLSKEHRSHSHNCNLFDSQVDVGEEALNVFKERACSRYRVVNYNFRPSVSNAKLQASKLHCSCLVLSSSLCDDSFSKEKLTTTKSAPNIQESALENWSLCNYVEHSSDTTESAVIQPEHIITIFT
ncbi:XK-related protein 7-like [Ornithodoros turicata]|uniref:XK-related protein 7-like n=1 Tax=Ornithodoros turicata TaxID=34597 RepID=UPI003138A6E1